MPFLRMRVSPRRCQSYGQPTYIPLVMTHLLTAPPFTRRRRIPPAVLTGAVRRA